MGSGEWGVTCRTTIMIDHNIQKWPAAVIDNAYEARSLVLDHSDAKMFVPHSVDPNRTTSEQVENLGPRCVADELDLVFDLELMREET